MTDIIGKLENSNLKSFKPFQLKFKFFYQIYMNQNAKKPMI